MTVPVPIPAESPEPEVLNVCTGFRTMQPTVNVESICWIAGYIWKAQRPSGGDGS